MAMQMKISLLTLIIISFAAMAAFGLGHMSGMIANESGDMAGCIFTGKTMLCNMSVVEHISLWQSMLTAIPQENLTILALLTLLVTVIFITTNMLAPPRLSGSEALTKRLYLRGHPDLLLFNPLQEAFSQGILNPKIY